MITTIITAHEERYSDKSKTLGIVLNLNQNNERIDSFPYIYRQGTYIFFSTIIDMNEHLLYGTGKTKRAYMSEEDYDKLYDNPINGTFLENLTWSQ